MSVMGLETFYRLKGILNQRFGIHLRHMALVAEITPWRNIRQHIFIAVAEVRLADFGGAGFLVVGPTVTGETFIKLDVNPVTLGRMGNQWWLLHIVAFNWITIPLPSSGHGNP